MLSPSEPTLSKYSTPDTQSSASNCVVRASGFKPIIPGSSPELSLTIIASGSTSWPSNKFSLGPASIVPLLFTLNSVSNCVLTFLIALYADSKLWFPVYRFVVLSIVGAL